MNPLRAFELALGGVNLGACWLIGSKNIWGQRLSLLSNLMWWVYIVWAHAWGLIPMEIGFSIVVLRSWLRWERDLRGSP